MAATGNISIINRRKKTVIGSTDYRDRFFFLNTLSSEVAQRQNLSLNKAIWRTSEDISRIHTLYKSYHSIFGSHSEEVVLKICERVCRVLPTLCLDYYNINVLREEECLFFYGQKGTEKFFLNFFFEEEIEVLLTLTMEDGVRVEEGSMEELLHKLVILWNGRRDSLS